MNFLTDDETAALTIRRMIFHLVGSHLEQPGLLSEITPLQEPAFFLDRVKSALKGNLFKFQDSSAVEVSLRVIADGGDFTLETQSLAHKFQLLHRRGTSPGVFLVFELDVGNGNFAYALIKNDNDDVVRYDIPEGGASQVPTLELFKTAFVKKAEAMQKIALVRLDAKGGRILVRDRTNLAHISEYFQSFLDARRVNDGGELSAKLVEVIKDVFRQHKAELPLDVQIGGVNRIYDVLRQPGRTFDPSAPDSLLLPIFGPVGDEAPLRSTLQRELRRKNMADETFEILPDRVQKPRKRVIETTEGVQVRYDEGNRPHIRTLENGDRRIEIVTAKITRDDVDTEGRPRER